MAKNSAEKGKGADTTVFAFGIFGGLILLWVLWFIAHNFLSWTMVRSRELELAAIGFLAHFLVGENAPENFAHYYAQITTINLSFASTLQIMRESGLYARWLLAPPVFLIGVVLFWYAPTAKFKKNYTMRSLAKQESKIWPEISPVIELNLVKGDIKKGPWGISQTEWEFARKHKLVKAPDSQHKTVHQVPGAARLKYVPGANEEEIDTRERLDKDLARSKFIEQLGAQWLGIHRAAPYVRGIYAACLVRIVAKDFTDINKIAKHITESNNLFRTMAKEYATYGGDVSRMDFSGADRIIATYKDHPVVKMMDARHAYTYTLMASMLHVSRKNGVVASAMFIWLRPVDRRLWYILNNVGGYTYFPECAGIAAHWLTERGVGVALIYPCVEEAVLGLEIALKDYIEVDDYEILFE